MRAGSLIKVLLVALVMAAIATAVAIFIPWLPEQSSKEAERIDFVFWFVTSICIAIFAVVAAISVYSLVKFRARPDDDSDGPPVHGHTGIEIAWTAIPLVLVMLAAAAGRLRWAELSVAAGLFALLAGPGPARWPGALLVAGGWLADEGQALVVRATAWTRGVLARIAWIAAALLALPAVEGALRAEVVYTVAALGALFATALRLVFRPAGVRAEPTALYSPPQT